MQPATTMLPLRAAAPSCLRAFVPPWLPHPLVASSLLCLLITATAHAGPYRLWVASSSEKVFRDTPPRPGPGAGLVLCGARNEHVAGQLVIRGPQALQAMRVEVSDLQRGSDRMPAALFQVHLVSYIHLPAHDRDYPDALPLLRGTFDVAAGASQPLWIACVIPADAAPGVYRGTLTVGPADGHVRRIPLSLQVWNFAIPEAVPVRAVCRIGGGNYAAYYAFLRERRVCARELPVDLDAPEADAYLTHPRLSGFRFPGEGAVTPAALEKARALGVLDKGFVRIVDEPKTEERFQKIRAIAQTIREHNPEVVQMVCFNRTVPGPWANGKTIWQLAEGHVGIWCLYSALMSDQANRRAAAERRRAGDAIWIYVCSWPKPPYANFLVDGDGVEPRILFWQMWKYEITGIYHWGMASWKDGIDPWENAATRREWPELYGDGSLLYPGGPEDGEDPVTSIRLENIRDGIEDYCYLHMLHHLAGSRTAAAERVDQVVSSWTDTTRDAAHLERVRHDVGSLLARAGTRR